MSFNEISYSTDRPVLIPSQNNTCCALCECTLDELWATHLLRRRNSYSQTADISWRFWVHLYHRIFLLDRLLENQRNKFSYYVSISLRCIPNYCPFHRLDVVLRLCFCKVNIWIKTSVHPQLPPYHVYIWAEDIVSRCHHSEPLSLI